MLERLSTSHDGAVQKSRAKGDKFAVFGSKKQVSFHVHISELRAELMGSKQHVPGTPCVLQWVRGDTVHVTEESVGRTVLSWSDTYFAQVITLQISGSGFRPKECKFKVQQKGKTVAKTATLDLSKYCSDQGLARDQPVAVPLQPGGTLYFVISTSPAAAELPQPSLLGAQQPTDYTRGGDHPSGGNSTLERASQATAGGAAAAAADLGLGAAAAPVAAAPAGGRQGGEPRLSRGLTGILAGFVSAHGDYAGNDRTSAQSRQAAAAVAAAGAAATAAAGAAAGAGDRASQLAGTSQRQGRLPTAGGGTAAAALGVTAFSEAAAVTRKTSVGEDSEHGGIGIFRRKARAGSRQAGGPVGGSTGSSPQKEQQQKQHPLPLLRKSESLGGAPGAGTAAAGMWEPQTERSLSQAVVGTSAPVPYSPSQRAIRSFSCSPGPAPPVPLAGLAGKPAPMMQLPLQLPACAAQDSGGACGGGKSLARASAAASTSSRSDTGVALGGIAAFGGGAAAKSAGSGGAAPAGEGGGGGGWGAWLRGGLGWGRSSNHSATGTSTTGALSQASLAGQGFGPGEGGGGGGGGAVEHESTKLEAAILAATEPAELREFAVDLLKERDEWRRRALTAQDALNRAQMARGAAVREAQRLEVRLKQYQDELGRSTDGSLLQELVEAKLQIAELANENMKLRRQITHMGPLFYDDSGDDGPNGDI